MFACIYIPNASGDTAAALINCASAFSPRVEKTSAGTVVFDVEGLERLLGSYPEIAAKIAERVGAAGLHADVALAANAEAAICAARGFRGISVLNRGTEGARLRDLPLTVLSPLPEMLETLERWGIRTLGAFAQLPAVQVSERLGQEGVKLHKLAQGTGLRPLVPHAGTVRFVEAMELDYDITTIEPLTFILSRMLDGICARMRARNLATHEVRLALGGGTRVLNLPLPVNNPRLLTKLLILDLEAHPAGAPVKRVEVEAIPAKPRVVQNGLFVPLSPEPEKLELTLARLKAVVGEENVGAPEVLDTHRPDALKMVRFPNSPPKLGGVAATLRKRSRSEAEQTGWFLNRNVAAQEPPRPRYRSGTPPNLGGEFSLSPSLSSSLSSSTLPSTLSLRLLRPALEATVQLKNHIPDWIAFHGLHGPIATASGPWHTSGDWWRPNMWDREEWDIEVADALYRIYYDVHLDRWYAQGVYD